MQHTIFLTSVLISFLDFDPVMPGQTKTYEWAIAEQYGPTPTDPECLTWRYYSSVDVTRDQWDGLSGNLLTCRPGTLDEYGKQV